MPMFKLARKIVGRANRDEAPTPHRDSTRHFASNDRSYRVRMFLYATGIIVLYTLVCLRSIHPVTHG
jgi:hypothetical protein